MKMSTCHFEIHVHSLDAAREFYVDKLGLELLQLAPAIKLMALKAGEVRISIFADATEVQVASAEIGLLARAANDRFKIPGGQ